MKLNLRNRFLIPTLGLIVLGMGISTAVSYFQARDAITTSVNSQITQMSKFADSIVSSWFGDRQRDIRYWGNDKTFQAATKDSFVGQAARKAADTRLAETKNDYKYYEDIFIANAKGEIICSSNPDAVGKVKVDERSYFQESMKGQVVVSDVIKSKISGNPVSVVSAPIKEGEQIVGVFFAAVNIVDFSKMFIDPVKLGQGGYAYVVDRKGLVIAHPDPSLILEENVASYDWGKEILAKGDGVTTYNFKDEEKLAAFNRNKELGWTVIVSTPTAEVFAPVKSQGYVNLIAAGSISLLAALVILLVVRSTVNPINRVIAGLGEASEQVATGAKEVASSSQQLAEGSSEQAAALEESSSSLEEMTSMTRQNANNASQANTLMKEANQVVAKANESMQELTSSMQEISQASQQTSKIIKTIDEIAFQTNLLALNAAVEAARAGEAGAGFAVVADEVRNLAMRAAEAAKSTAGLIDGTVKKIQAGSELVSRTNQAFSEVARTSGRVDELVGEIAAASQEQAQGIEQVNRAVAEMDKVTQQTAAIAEESSGASREMSGQAEKMKLFVSELADIVGGHVNHAAKGKDPREKVAAPSSRKASAPSLPAPNRKPKELTKRKLKEESPERVIPMDGDDFNDF